MREQRKPGPLLVVCICSVAVLSCGCTAAVSQEDYDALQSELEDAEARAAMAETMATQSEEARDSLESELAQAQDSLSECLSATSNMSCGEAAANAWEATWKRHERIRQDVPERGTLLDLALWMVFPETPDWLDETTLCAVELQPDEDGVDSYCLIEAPDSDMLVKVRVEDQLVSMQCLGGESDYDYTVTTGNDGRIVQQMFVAAEDYAQLEWVGPEKMERFVAIYNGIAYTNLFPVNVGEHEDMYKSFVKWIYEVENDGGLIRENDRPLITVGLGQLRGLPYAGMALSESEALKRAFADLMFGVPSGSLALRSAS